MCSPIYSPCAASPNSCPPPTPPLKDSWCSPAFPLLSSSGWQWPWVKGTTKQGSSWELLVDIVPRHFSLRCLASPVCKAYWVTPVCVMLLNTKKHWSSSWRFGFLSSNRAELVQLVRDTRKNCSEQGHFPGYSGVSDRGLSLRRSYGLGWELPRRKVS